MHEHLYRRTNGNFITLFLLLVIACTAFNAADAFSQFRVENQSLANLVLCRDPNFRDAYGDIAKNLQSWVADAIARARNR